MGSSMSLRSGAIIIQLQKRRHWRQVVAYFLKTFAENPLVVCSCRIGPTEEAMLILTLLAHPYAVMLSTYVWMCANMTILGAKSRSYMSSAPSPRSFIVTSPMGLEEDNRCAWVVRGKEEGQTKYWPSGSRHTPPIPDPDALVVPIQVGAKSSNSQRWVGLLARMRTNSRQASSSLFTSSVSWKCLPAAILRACCTRVNIHLNPETAGLMLCSSPRSLRHLCREVVRAFLGMAASASATLSCRIGGRCSRWEIVSRSHPRTVF